MRGRTREEDGERGEKIWRIIEAVYEVVICGGEGWRVHVWRGCDEVVRKERECGWLCGLE